MSKQDIGPLCGIFFLFGAFACVVLGKQEEQETIAKYENVQVADNVVQRYAAMPEPTAYDRLTERQREMLAALAKHLNRRTR